MKKENKKGGGTVLLPVMMLCAVAIGVVFGIRMVGMLDFSGDFPLTDLLRLFVSFLLGCYLAMLLHVLLHETGHLVFGLLTGYRFTSFRLFCFMLVKDKQGVRLRIHRVAGTAGQCLMEPPRQAEKMPFVLYNLGGVLFNLFFSVLAAVGCFFLPAESLAHLLLTLFCVLGLYMAFMNGLPFGGGVVQNDGTNLLHACRSASARRGLWLQLAVSARLSAGVRMRDMPSEWFALPPAEDMQDGLSASIGVMAANRLLDEYRKEETAALLRRLLAETRPLPLHRHMMTMDLITLSLLLRDGEDVQKLLTPELEKTMLAMKDNITVLRTRYALAINSGDTVRAAELLAQFEKKAPKHPYPAELFTEQELMKELSVMQTM